MNFNLNFNKYAAWECDLESLKATNKQKIKRRTKFCRWSLTYHNFESWSVSV